MKITKNIEDYLEAIYFLSKDNGVARVKDIAQRLDVKNPSVTQQIQKLTTMNLVIHRNYGSVFLTDEGEKIGKKIAKRHSIFKHLLCDILDLPADLAEENACKMEHAVDPTTMKKFEKLLEFIAKHELNKDLHAFLAESED